MKIKNLKAIFFYTIAVGISIFLLFFVITVSWIGYDVKNQCQQAKREYGGDCVEALIATLKDEHNGFRARNYAISALGELGDARALPVLQDYYTGDIPPREPLDKTISQYELKKAINLTSGGLNIVAWLWRGSLDDVKNTKRESIRETVVVAERADPYFHLAQQIAQAEKLEIVETFAEISRFNPKYVILVAAPENLTKERFLDIGRYFTRSDYYPALGIISGSTLEAAERLWERRGSAREGSNYVGGDVEVTQRVYEPAIFDISAGANKKIALNKESLIGALKQADYFYWARHSGGTTWFWNSEAQDWGEDDALFTKDIPPLKPAVIYSPTCDSFRPWVKDAIALGFVDKGAAAYLGYINSPHTNAFLKRGLAVPGLTSWKGFPLGVVAQVHNKITTRTIFSVPQFFMLGDPRMYLSADQPYRILSDTTGEYGTRTIAGESDTVGMLALKIKDGADYDFVAIQGVTSAGEEDFFYNSKLQTLNLGTDKYITFLHPGGRFELTLALRAPFLWGVTDGLIDALDYSWVVLWLNVIVTDTPLIAAISLVIFAAILLVKLLRQKRPILVYRRIFIIGVLLTLFRLAYYLLRVDAYTVSANYVDSSALQVALGCAGFFACTCAGLILMQDARKTVGRIPGLVLAVLPQFLLTGFYLGFITFMNAASEINHMTVKGLWNYNAFWLPLVALVVEMGAILALYRFLVRGREELITKDTKSTEDTKRERI